MKRLKMIAAAIMVLSAGAATAQDLPTVSIGYFPDIWGGAIIEIAEQKGFFEEAGIKVDAQRFTAGAPAVAALASGSLNISFVGLGPMPAIMGGVAKVVGFDSVTYADQIIAQEDSGISSIEDLAGRTVMAPRSSGSQILLYLALQRAGMTPDDIKELGGSPATVVSAMMSKQADAAAIWAPFNAEIVDKTGAKVLASGRDFYPQYVWPGMWIANPSFVEDEPDLLKRALYAIQQANDWRAENRDEAAQIAARAYDLSDESVKLSVANTEYLTSDQIATFFEDGTIEKWMKGVNEQLGIVGALDTPIPSENFLVPGPWIDAATNGISD